MALEECADTSSMPEPLTPCDVVRLSSHLRSYGGMVAFVIAFFISVSPAIAQDRVVVTRGKEIVVSYKPTRQSSSIGAYAVRHLRLPSDLTVRDRMAHDRVAVVSSNTEVSLASAGPVEVDTADIERECARILEANRGVPLDCEANVTRFINRTPNDPTFEQLYGLTRMEAPAAWDITTGSSDVIVAIVDTGVYYNHTDLIDNIAVNRGEIPYNGIDDDGNGYIDDYFGYDFYAGDGDPVDEHGHGTHCAGIVGASGNNSAGVVGVNWQVGILPVRALGPHGGGTDADVATGIQYAVDRGASIISLSLGGSSSSAVIESAIQYARNAGILVVAASGNDSDNTDIFPTYPANAPVDNIVAVAATDSLDRLASFSNYGATSVHVAAPGSGIVSTYLADQFVSMSGTSMATPYVAGIAALMKSVNPSLGFAELKYALMESSDPLATLQDKVVANGRVNAYRAVLTAQSGVTPPVSTPIAAPGENGEARKLTISIKRYSRRTLIHGYIKTYAKEVLADKRIYLSCKTISARRTKSDDDGYYAFKVSRPRRAERCYVRDGLNNRSRSLAVR